MKSKIRKNWQPNALMLLILVMMSQTFVASAMAWQSDDNFAFLELFTSEGCSSCPPADRNLERIAAAAKTKSQNVYTLSWHVDYWNRLGWKDPYSSEQFTQRQNEYANQFNSTRIYTPQIVVNGQVEFVGSNKKTADQAVKLALELESKSKIKLKAVRSGKSVKIDWQAEGLATGDKVNVVLVQDQGAQKVTRGENANRNLTHINIVRRFKTIKNPSKSGTTSLDVPTGFENDKFHVIGFVQSASSVRAVAKASIATSKGKVSKATTKAGTLNRLQLEVAMLDRRQPDSHRYVKFEGKDFVDAQGFLNLLRGDGTNLRETVAELDRTWDVSYVPMILEVIRFLPPKSRLPFFSLMQKKTDQKQLGIDFDSWMQWNWKQKYDQHPEYAEFKSKLYSNVDPRFAEYFAETEGSRIRLDEIRWGGVRRDGIPPLKNPKMLKAAQASYLSDSDVVFGIELNGDARCYPKRILAWHEMFKDTIGGESVCGVY